MKQNDFRSAIRFAAAAALGLGLTFGAQAQQRQGGGGGFGGGGFGGGGGGGGNRGGSSSSSQTYNPNGGVGSAMISVDPDTHNITVIADEKTMEAVIKVLASLDHPRPQVLIKVVFLEVQHTDATDIGIEGGWAARLTGSTTGSVANAFGASSLNTGVSNIVPNALGQPISAFNQTPSGAGLYQVLGKDFQATLRAIQLAGKSQLLSRPSVMARDGQPDTIVIGQSVPLITGTRYDSLGNSINSVTYTDVGIILKVTPYVTSDGLVQMIVAPQISARNVDSTVQISANVNAPVIDVRSADTVVITPDSQTVVIGGLMKNDNAQSETKIPLLGDIPYLGNLFKRKTKTSDKNELLIFLTPYIVRSPGELAEMADREKTRSWTHEPTTEKELERFLDKVPVKKDDADDGKKKKKNQP